ncbi:MAG: hypothetical protein AVDCRST_MAG21-402, partial [uncultured Nocardioidaceae bacterium]
GSRRWSHRRPGSVAGRLLPAQARRTAAPRRLRGVVVLTATAEVLGL